MAWMGHGELVKLAQPTDGKRATQSTCMNRELRMVRRARQMNAQQELISKVYEQKQWIMKLKAQLENWERWYCNMKWLTA